MHAQTRGAAEAKQDTCLRTVYPAPPGTVALQPRLTTQNRKAAPTQNPFVSNCGLWFKGGVCSPGSQWLTVGAQRVEWRWIVTQAGQCLHTPTSFQQAV
jgi:hypothetical protein